MAKYKKCKICEGHKKGRSYTLSNSRSYAMPYICNDCMEKHNTTIIGNIIFKGAK